jgi:hypothetical protein
MNTMNRRVRKLEDRLWIGDGKRQRLLVIVCQAGLALALDKDRCIQILDACGFLPTGPMGIVDLGQIPDGLNAEGLERYLRKDGAKTCGLRGMTSENRSGGDA